MISVSFMSVSKAETVDLYEIPTVPLFKRIVLIKGILFCGSGGVTGVGVGVGSGGVTGGVGVGVGVGVGSGGVIGGVRIMVAITKSRAVRFDRFGCLPATLI